MTRPSDRAYAQAVRELENWPPGDQLSAPSAAVWITRRAREIDAAAPKCGTCNETIRPDAMTGTTCACAAAPEGAQPVADMVAAPRALLEAVLSRDGGKACRCIGVSRKAEREYESGNCPHQRLAAVLAAPPQPQDAARDREDAELQQLAVLAEIRKAIGDDGKLMQDELVEAIAKLAEDAKRYRWLRKDAFWETSADGYWLQFPAVLGKKTRRRKSNDDVDRDIDAARGAGGGGHD